MIQSESGQHATLVQLACGRDYENWPWFESIYTYFQLYFIRDH